MQSRCKTGICGLFLKEARARLAFMSLNRTEQLLFDYVQRHPEERQHWSGKVLSLAARIPDVHLAATALETELWRYYEERSQVSEPFRSLVRREGLQRISLRNLAEYLLRLWGPPPRAKRRAAEDRGET